MAYAPVEIRHVRLPRGIFGYRRKATDRLLSEVADSFEDVWSNRADLADRVEALEAEVERYRELESLMRATMMTAERTAGELRDQARREADLILSEAHAEARAVARRAEADLERLLTHANRIRVELRTALEVLDVSDGGEEPAGAREAA